MQGQSEASLQATKTSDIKEGQEDKTCIIIPFTGMILTGYFHNYD